MQSTLDAEKESRGNCFEIFGFDILLDESLRPWLLEVNLSPSMESDSPLDHCVKSHLLADALTLVGMNFGEKPSLSQARWQNQFGGGADVVNSPVGRNGPKRRGGYGPKGRNRLDRADEEALRLLSQRQLTILANALAEMGRAQERNFIRLYPQGRTVSRYRHILTALDEEGDGRLFGAPSASQLLTLLFAEDA